MRILMITRVYGRRGGIARTSLETAERLAARGHHITVLTNQVDSDYDFENIDFRRVRLLGLPHSVGIKLKNLIEVPQFVLFSTIAVLFMRRRYDIVWN
ncbi:MAG: glycosyltransferase, partial [Bacteroidales bacterium]|nr:glycosyltransferase [Candidatus Latescibacterota bacterium]